MIHIYNRIHEIHFDNESMDESLISCHFKPKIVKFELWKLMSAVSEIILFIYSIDFNVDYSEPHNLGIEWRTVVNTLVTLELIVFPCFTCCESKFDLIITQ